MESNNEGLYARLTEEYRGLNVSDLSETHPDKSCVICGNIECPRHNMPKRSCPEHVYVQESKWISFYNFYNPNHQ